MGVMDILNEAELAVADVSLCLRQDLDQKKRDLLAEKIQLGLGKATDRMVSPQEVRISEIDSEVEAINEKMAASTLTFHMRGKSKTEYNALQRMSGLPRKDNQNDLISGFNVDVFYENLIKACTYKVSSPDGDEEAWDNSKWSLLLQKVNDAQYDELAKCANKVNREAVNPPSAGRTFGPPRSSAGK